MTRLPVTRPASRFAALILGAVLLCGCVSLLPKGKPAQLYRFAVPTSAASDASGAWQGDAWIGLALARIDMQRAAAGDQILTVSGDQAAFIAGARWLSPASALFEAAVQDGFAARSRTVRLLDRAEFAAARGSLRLDVPAFETRYRSAGTGPTVHVEVRATLTHRAGAFAAARAFSADVPAAQNRVSAIVAAYDAAVGQVVAELVSWTDGEAALAAASPPEPPQAAPPARRTTTRSTSTTVDSRP